MELRHLKYFHTVASHLHFNNAAKELNISQPPLSKQIRQLEEELNVRLLNRTNRKVELTEAGVYFANSCKFILNLIEKEVETTDRKSTRLNSSHVSISYAVFCLKKKREIN